MVLSHSFSEKLLRLQYVFSADFKWEIVISLTDIDECTTKTHNCSENATCTDTAGSFVCECKAGFTGNGTYCQGKANAVTCSSEDSIAISDAMQIFSYGNDQFLKNNDIWIMISICLKFA